MSHVSPKHPTSRVVAVALIATVALAMGAAGAASPARVAPIVSVTRHGGLCRTASECTSVLIIGDASISGEGFKTRRLAPADRSALLRAIGRLDLAYLRAHPFKGTCPTAYDGQESIYRFRGFARSLPGCTYDLRGVEAVRLVERLIGTLRPK
jgi:hypothetical protein